MKTIYLILLTVLVNSTKFKLFIFKIFLKV